MPQPYPNGELVIVIDCSDLDRSAAFWSGVLGYTSRPPSTGPASAGPASTAPASTAPASTAPYRSLQPDSGVGIDMLLQRMPEGKWQ